jgi:hypothetical protein
MYELRNMGILSWYSTRRKGISLSTVNNPTHRTAKQSSREDCHGHTALDPSRLESAQADSYFPSRILGYISYEDDPEDMQDSINGQGL